MLGTYKEEPANTQELTAEKTGGEALHMLKGPGRGPGAEIHFLWKKGMFSNIHKGAMCAPSSPGLRCSLRAH